ncbi:MBL fold metallo-hydrolase [Methanoplanus endosymbiosus]|uniref:MBL fold metallo-hydrolase n=1 Tax=Methanoplanus endosymbiosus TaxID=33865 RepID=A0A9E7PTP9_9EURY|nr:MBL fold metallo-hydrolase [Methanoplanus endosymbiosus]UUX93772.1 MBL fold metallo-hydrolase [Methanoplanus endosymbiosus]
MTVEWIRGTGYYANSYVYENVLFDAGILPDQISGYWDVIDTIILTHCHYDHIAHVREIKALTGGKVCIHSLDVSGLTEGHRNLSMMFGERSPGITPDRVLNDGDYISGIKIIHTPGHTPGGICGYIEEEKALISGDTVFTDGGYGRCDFPGGSAEDLERSIDKLRSYDVEGLYPGHGIPVQSNGNGHILSALKMIRLC